MSKLHDAASDLGAFLDELAQKYELDYDEILFLMSEYVACVKRHKQQFELQQLKERFGS